MTSDGGSLSSLDSGDQREPRSYPVSRSGRKPLLDFFVDGLVQAGCTILHRPDPGVAPFRIVLETPWQERIGIILYAFRSTSRVTRNRPTDEARFQVKYGPRTEELHPIFDDPFKLYTTLMVGIDLESGVVISADPAIHNPTRFYISVEYKNADAELSLTKGWHAWERVKRGRQEPIEILVGCSQERVLDLVMFERMAQTLDQGHRQLLAEQVADGSASRRLVAFRGRRDVDQHSLLKELAVERDVLLDIIENANRLKTAVRGWVAQHHLHERIAKAPGVRSCEAIEEDGRPDFRVSIGAAPPILIECKNVLRKANAQGVPRLDFQRTRASIGDPCSRYYSASEFEVVAACLHPVSERWEFMYKRTDGMAPHDRCAGKLSSNVLVNGSWTDDLAGLLASLR
jgi:Methylase-associated X1